MENIFHPVSQYCESASTDLKGGFYGHLFLNTEITITPGESDKFANER
jgi:hypothetical protein